MTKLLIFTNILTICLVVIGRCSGDVIQLPVQSHRQFDVESVNLEANSEPYSPHVFEVEPSTAPLRIMFNSESSPLSLELEKTIEKVFQETPVRHSSQAAPDAKQDRKGVVGEGAASEATGAAAGPTAGDKSQTRAFNDDDYIVVDSYSRYIPIKVRDSPEGMESDDHVVYIKPAKVVKPDPKQKFKKIKVPVVKAEKLTTSKPTPIKPTVAKATPAETITQASVQKKSESNKFGARLVRQSSKKEESDKKQE